ncbi:MAG: hypothetical protein ACLP6G_19915 [Terriglobales bacterium]
MVPLTALWLPIVLAAVIVFVASSVIHMLLKYHNRDYRKLPDEDKLLAAMRPANLTPGLYVFPHCTHKDMKSPAMMEKFKQGPVGFLTLRPNGPPAMGKFMTQWFAYCLVIGFFVAYLTGRVLGPGTPYPAVFRVAGTAGFLGYGLGGLSNGIWKGQPWSSVIKELFDGLVYGLLTAGTFGWLWPR